MRTTADSGGRIVVPKKMRDMLGLVAGSEVEIELDGPSIALRVSPVQPPAEIVEKNGVFFVKSRGGGRIITDETIRTVLEATRDRLW